MSDPRERDDIFRNRIADALRWSDENSDAVIERELAEIEAAPLGVAPLSHDEVSRILAKTTAMRADSVRSPAAGEKGHDQSTPAHGDAVMKTTNPNVRPAVTRTKPTGSSSVLAIVTSCACLLAALGLFQATGVQEGDGSSDKVATNDSSTSFSASTFASVDSARFAYPAKLVPQRREAAPVERVKVGDVIRTAERERRRVTLPDGSVLFVNQQTVATIETPRRVRVDSGEVYVEAVPENLLDGELRTKFVVQAPDRSVTALGTKFAVKVKRRRKGKGKM